jgi:hypothetical protein
MKLVSNTGGGMKTSHTVNFRGRGADLGKSDTRKVETP